MWLQALMTMMTQRINIVVVTKLIGLKTRCINSCKNRVEMDKILYNVCRWPLVHQPHEIEKIAYEWYNFSIKIYL
jgi:hypothetical protein